MHNVPPEYQKADEIRAYEKGFYDGYSNKPYYEFPDDRDYQRMDNLRCAYALGRSAGQLRRKEEIAKNGRMD